MQRSAARLAFECYLRTGRRLPLGVFTDHHAPLGTKFNPYHDPRNGQFTFAPGGLSNAHKNPGVQGRGGFIGGGGGASGNWRRPSSVPPRGSAQRKVSNQSGRTSLQAVAASPSAEPQGRLIVQNGYSYRLDAANRTTSATGRLTLASVQQRSRSAQAKAGGNDRLSTDDGGHYVAARFNGPTDTFNHFAQDANFNRGDYRVLENGWAKSIKEGKQIYVAITPKYVGSSNRPNIIKVVYTINGVRSSQTFSNSPKRKSHGK